MESDDTEYVQAKDVESTLTANAEHWIKWTLCYMKITLLNLTG